jgi:hypothetical protein
MKQQFVALWPIDPDVPWLAAVNEGRRRVQAMLTQAGVELLGEGTFTTHATTADEGNLAATMLVFRCPARPLPSVLDPYLPSDVVIREPGHSTEKTARVEALLAQGRSCREIAEHAGIGVRQVERAKAHGRTG